MEDQSPGPVERPQARMYSERAYEEREKIARQTRGSISTGRWMWEWFKAISTAIVLFLLVRTFVVEAFKIPTGSMEGTLLVGDFLLVNKAVYGAEVPIVGGQLPAFDAPDRGDVIVFVPPHDPAKNYVKRLVGLPGDTLGMRDKLLYINGEPQIEPYVRHIDPLSDPHDPRMMWQAGYLIPGEWETPYRPTRDNWGPIEVPPGKFFAMGDNRDKSDDSRYWGFVDAGSVKGQPMFVYYSFQRGVSPVAWATEVRWHRIGDVIR